MDIAKILLFVLMSLFLVVILKGRNREFGIFLSIISCSCLLLAFVLKTQEIWQELISLFDFGGVNFLYAEVLLKIVGISFLSQAVSNLCCDAGETSLGKSSILLGKMSVLILCIPIIKDAVEAVKSVLML